MHVSEHVQCTHLQIFVPHRLKKQKKRREEKKEKRKKTAIMGGGNKPRVESRVVDSVSGSITGRVQNTRPKSQKMLNPPP